MRIHKIVNMSIIGSAFGILVTFPFQDTWWGGLLFTACSAATIGGLADTFAVKALFGDPLGFRWPRFMGTRIIQRKREELIGELVNMVQNELLTISSIEAKLNEYNIADVIMTYVKQHGGREAIHDLVQGLLEHIVNHMDREDLARNIQAFVFNHADHVQVSDLVADLGDWAIRHQYDEKVIQFILDEIMKMVHTREFRSVVEKLVQSVLLSYEGDKVHRKKFNALLKLDASKIEHLLISYIERLAASDHPLRKQLKAFIEQGVQRIRVDEQLRHRIEAGKMTFIRSIEPYVHFDVLMNEYFATHQQTAVADETGNVVLFPWLSKKIDDEISKLEHSDDRLNQLDAAIKTGLIQWIEQKQSYIGRVVEEKLNAYSEEDLIDLLQEKADHDLQYIRLNGTLIGAIVGGLLYITTFWIGR
ncbi:hypothetical protein BVG16_01305 [Paenibacillus selenitireducens]|uniref:DUF445 domain-containing protein n=1 Tax=Paenibacillus selenitireducens TaxID=1324314 RepID=A0A1T2XMG7_9BACL|nr:DUF445 domain-containing protein [Paenibacillus selenitireducens]OPA81012.1 hypothetical protein BVG16_01305 [Paenibacillus selenitireducens]